MTKDPNFVSVRLPDDVAYWLREYATDNKLVRADKPNMGGSIIAIIRSVMQSQTISNNVRQSSAAPDVDIESMIENAIAPLLARLEAVETKLSTEATAPRKFYSSAIAESESNSATEVDGSSIESDALPTIEAIATIKAPIVKNPFPDATLSDEIAATDIDKGMNTQEAFLIAQQRGYKGNAKSFRDRFDKQDMAKDFGLRRIPHDGGREKWLYFDIKTQS